MGNVYHPRLYHMLLTSICPVSMAHLFYLCGSNLSIFTWKRQYFMSGCFDCPCLMYIDMPAYRCDRSLIWAECRTDHRCIGLCSSYQEMHIHILTFTQILNLLSCTVAVWIQPISVGLLHIRLYHPLHNCRMCSFCIIALKSIHAPFSPSVLFLPETHGDTPVHAPSQFQSFLLYNTAFPVFLRMQLSAGSYLPAQM